MASNQIWNADDYNEINKSQMRDALETMDQIIKDGLKRSVHLYLATFYSIQSIHWIIVKMLKSITIFFIKAPQSS